MSDKNIMARYALFGILINAAIAIAVAISSYMLTGVKEANDTAIAAINSAIDEQKSINEFTISKLNVSLSERRLNLNQLKFVKDLLPDMLSGDTQAQLSNIALMEFALNRRQYEKLINILKNSNAEKLVNIASLAIDQQTKQNAEDTIDINNWINKLSSPTKTVRRQALDNLYEKYTDNPLLVKLLGESILANNYNQDGRINIFYVLNRVLPSVWNLIQIEYIRGAITHLEDRAKTEPDTQNIGPKTKSITEIVERKINAYEQTLRLQ